jgi:hypothetical protein
METVNKFDYTQFVTNKQDGVIDGLISNINIDALNEYILNNYQGKDSKDSKDFFENLSQYFNERYIFCLLISEFINAHALKQQSKTNELVDFLNANNDKILDGLIQMVFIQFKKGLLPKTMNQFYCRISIDKYPKVLAIDTYIDCIYLIDKNKLFELLIQKETKLFKKQNEDLGLNVNTTSTLSPTSNSRRKLYFPNNNATPAGGGKRNFTKNRKSKVLKNKTHKRKYNNTFLL